MYHIAISRFYLGLGIGFWIIPLMAMPVNVLPADQLSNGLGIFHFVRALAGGIGTSVYTTIFARRTIHYHEILTTKFNEYSPKAMEYLSDIQSYGINKKSALAIANTVADKEAAVFAIDEVFWVMSLVCFSLALLIFFTIKRGKGRDNPKMNIEIGH